MTRGPVRVVPDESSARRRHPAPRRCAEAKRADVSVVAQAFPLESLDMSIASAPAPIAFTS